jgi:hypothetical protein
MSRQQRRAAERRARKEGAKPVMKVIVDSVLWGFAKYYHKLHVQEHPKHKEVSSA